MSTLLVDDSGVYWLQESARDCTKLRGREIYVLPRYLKWYNLSNVRKLRYRLSCLVVSQDATWLAIKYVDSLVENNTN